jgi:predicted esterase/GNAT superfamily N-acetyltransferase
MSVRPLALSDLDALRAFVFQSHVDRSAYDAASRAAQTEDLPTDFPDLLTPASFAALSLGAWGVEDEQGALIGASGLKRGAEPAEMWLSYLFVSQARERAGLGRALLRAAVAQAQALAGAAGARLRLLTLEGTYAAAVRLYEREGFALYKRVPPSADDGACPFYTLLYMERRVGPEEASGGSSGDSSSSSSSSSSSAELAPGEPGPPASPLAPTVLLDRGAGAPRVLVLHGYSQNAQDFLARYKPLLERKLKFCTLVAPSAPFPLPASPSARTWWFNTSPDPTRSGTYEGLETSRALLLALAAQHGPFDGVLGFSQGAVLAHQLLAEGSLPGCQWAVLAAGFPSRAAPPPHPPLLLPTPSLHLSSAADATVAPALHAELAARFEAPQLLLHEHGHALVQRAEHCNAVVDFIKRHSKK